jgi:5-methylcytosine-specific restriction protein A
LILKGKSPIFLVTFLVTSGYIVDSKGKVLVTMKKHRKYAGLYKKAEWINGRIIQLKKFPLCALCGEPANVVHHKVAHDGDERLFFDTSNWESLCKRCHDSDEQSEEIRGHSTRLGLDGWPVDARHPANGGAPRARPAYSSIPYALRPSSHHVTLVYGPPLSGRSAYIAEHASKGDRIIDDAIIARDCGLPRWADDMRLVKARDRALVAIAKLPLTTRVWVTASMPTQAERDAWQTYYKNATFVRLCPERRSLVGMYRAKKEPSERLLRLINAWYSAAD